MNDKIHDIFIVLVLPTKSDIKQHAVHNIHRLAGGSMVVGPPGNCPVFPCVKKALVMLLWTIHLRYVYVSNWIIFSECQGKDKCHVVGTKWKEGDFEYTCTKSDNVYAKKLVTGSDETHVGKRTSVEIFDNFIIHF